MMNQPALTMSEMALHTARNALDRIDRAARIALIISRAVLEARAEVQHKGKSMALYTISKAHMCHSAISTEAAPSTVSVV
jgi:predicted lipoprotein with Yx(FWY)xxD motif